MANKEQLQYHKNHPAVVSTAQMMSALFGTRKKQNPVSSEEKINDAQVKNEQNQFSKQVSADKDNSPVDLLKDFSDSMSPRPR
jgi:hypothetical protein